MTVPDVAVSYADDDPNGLGSMLGALIERNLERDPARRRLLRPMVVALSATDAGVAATLRIGPGGVEVGNGADPGADLQVATDARRLLELAAVPLRFGLPDPFTAPGREVVGALLRRTLRVRGLVRHVAGLGRVNRLLSAS